MLLYDLDPYGNTFVTINPADDSGWYASVSLLDYLTSWLVDREYPDRPASAT